MCIVEAPRFSLHFLPQARIVLQLRQVRACLFAKGLELRLLLGDRITDLFREPVDVALRYGDLADSQLAEAAEAAGAAAGGRSRNSSCGKSAARACLISSYPALCCHFSA